eukprot:TRINITY_DN13146_c0_g1_i1.p1 TRINITY_DN13146_c0_g1~~TRINITY_DN13146_c0_g1_i1.p1  ORF type:complete len:317 (-),score=51.40 TRINITY_DN13146_c0_g1_i1:231-1181(-)
MLSFVRQSHPAQLAIVGGLFAANVASLFWINRIKAKGSTCTWSWKQKRAAYWSYMLAAVVGGCWMDQRYVANEYLLAMKAYVLAFPVGLLDFYFSDVKFVSAKAIVGAGLWCSTLMLQLFCIQSCYGRDATSVMPDFSPASLLREGVRFLVYVLCIGMLSDLIFSPMHRLAHLPQTYQYHHKVHHEYTNKLTSLVLYHGALLDDFLMPFTTTSGGMVYNWLASLVGLQAYTYSNVCGMLITFNTLFSHAHDVRCASLMVPLPDALNFSAYHRLHHLHPSSNFGLTQPSDVVWDAILGQRTIREPGELTEMNESKRM